LTKLEPLKQKKKQDFLNDPYLQDIVERNLEVAAQVVIDIANRIISLDQLEKPHDYYEAILRLGEARIIPQDFCQKLAPVAGFRNVLVHGYIDINWDEVFKNLQRTQDLNKFMEHVKAWMAAKDLP